MIENIAGFWHHLSIPYKVGVLCASFILPMSILIGVLFSEFYFYHEQTDRILQEYSRCSDFSAAIEQETEQIERMSYEVINQKELEQWQTVRSQSDRLFADLSVDEKSDSPDVKCIKQVIARTMDTYRSLQDEFLQDVQQDVFKQQTFSDLQAEGRYLCGYAGELTEALLLEGKGTYLDLGQQLARRNMILIVWIILCMLGMSVGITLLVRNIVVPVRQLRDSSLQVAQGRYDIADLNYLQTDEIGQLAGAFNQMKYQISQTIHALETEAQMEKDLRQHEAEEARLNQLVEHSRFAQLQSQINPHFLFNTLQSIANMAELENAAVSEDMILRLAKFFRYTLETDQSMVTLARELDLLRDYISLQEMRFGDRILFEMDCEASCDRFFVPKFILQPLVENAIIHGMKQRSSGGRIRITSRRTPDGCCVTIADNGCGFDPTAPPAAHPDGKQSIGLHNIAQRIATAGGSLHVFSLRGWGTAARIRICERRESEHDKNRCSRG